MAVDEAQDLHPAQWRLLRAAAPARPDDLFIAGDPHQRIYDTKVSLKAVGVRVTGRSTKMRKNYRSTHEILSWSTALLVGRPFEQLADDGRHETLLGYRFGPARQRARRCSPGLRRRQSSRARRTGPWVARQRYRAGRDRHQRPVQPGVRRGGGTARGGRNPCRAAAR
nr:UvrD-helicase domain-containing protein [Streptomyces sp. MBT51]